ncbi:MAG: hypothetical protein HYV47_03420 [Candidatus Nealsonbacteria bacterium]|nr:hypothetical protein [Candidatus Nealsonbacteria bacterium]
MEAYKTICPDCGHVRFWVGYKTGIGKTPEQLQAMHDARITCVKCGSKKANTELDRESEAGQVYGESYKYAAGMIADILKQKLKK